MVNWRYRFNILFLFVLTFHNWTAQRGLMMALKYPIPVTKTLLDETIASKLSSEFRERYGSDPEWIVQAPGRVNLIGEHIDYAGYGVLPMAISKTVWIALASSEEEDSIEIQHLRSNQFPSGVVTSNPEDPLPTTGHVWYHYVQCGYKGAWLLYDSESDGNKRAGCGMKLLVEGNVPLAAGLSSSSALVVASLVASLTARKFHGTLEELADLARRAEGYIGTMGGGMDQASSMLGHARRVDFDPVRTVPVPLSPRAAFVIANSLTSAEKAVGSHLRYNKRVVEMMLASKVLARALEFPDVLAFKTFKQVQDAYTTKAKREVSLEEMSDLVRTHLHGGGYTEEQLEAILAPHSWDSWFPHASKDERTWIENVREAASEYALHERALHVYTEAHRVGLFEQACVNNEPLETLGKLMNESQTSCAELYDCSSPELDTLTATCRKLGALGSRLTGAGWGGCTVSLVEIDRVEEFMRGLKASYYDKYHPEANLDDACFAAVPTPGVCLFSPSGKDIETEL